MCVAEHDRPVLSGARVPGRRGAAASANENERGQGKAVEIKPSQVPAHREDWGGTRETWRRGAGRYGTYSHVLSVPFYFVALPLSIYI